MEGRDVVREKNDINGNILFTKKKIYSFCNRNVGETKVLVVANLFIIYCFLRLIKKVTGVRIKGLFLDGKIRLVGSKLEYLKG